MSYITVGKENSSNIDIYFKEWGTGQPIVFSHGWPLSADAWEDQMLFLSAHGYRCIAHDRRGHGRSSQPSSGNDMDTYADDLAALVKALNLKDAIHVGHSTGGGEVARYIGRHGSKRVVKAVLISAVPPLMLKTDKNPGGLPLEVFDEFVLRPWLIAHSLAKISPCRFMGLTDLVLKYLQAYANLFGYKRCFVASKVFMNVSNSFQKPISLKILKKMDMPTLFIHGDDDQIVPYKDASELAVKIVKQGKLKIYRGAPHGLCSTHKNKVNEDLLAFFKE